LFSGSVGEQNTYGPELTLWRSVACCYSAVKTSNTGLHTFCQVECGMGQGSRFILRSWA